MDSQRERPSKGIARILTMRVAPVSPNRVALSIKQISESNFGSELANTSFVARPTTVANRKHICLEHTTSWQSLEFKLGESLSATGPTRRALPSQGVVAALSPSEPSELSVIHASGEQNLIWVWTLQSEFLGQASSSRDERDANRPAPSAIEMRSS